MKEIKFEGKDSFMCSICGFHYRDKKTAEECENFCRKHGGCSMEITKDSMERSARKAL